MAKMTGFIFQDEYLERLAKLSDQELGRLVRALAIYHATGEQQELAGRESIAYDFIKVDIDRIDAKYEAKCETNRRSRVGTNVDERARTTTNVDERQQTSSNVPKDKDKVKDIDDDATARAHETAFGTVDVDPVIITIQRELSGLTVSHYDDLSAFRKDLPDDLIIEAVNEAVAHGARTWAYVRSILQGYIKDGIKTVGQARERSERRKRQSNPGKQVTAQQYTQREYTEDELEARITSL